MSAPASNCVDTPIFCITLAPRPKNRILRPLSCSSGLSIGCLNQPEVSGPMQKQSIAVAPCWL